MRKLQAQSYVITTNITVRGLSCCFDDVASLNAHWDHLQAVQMMVDQYQDQIV